MNLSELNWLAVVVAAVSAFVLGGLWYGAIFGKAWQQQLGLSDEQVAGGNAALIFGGSFVLSLVISIGLAGLISAVIPAPALVSGLLLGLEISIVLWRHLSVLTTCLRVTRWRFLVLMPAT